MTESHKSNFSPRIFFLFDRAIFWLLDRLKKFLLGIGLGLQIISIFYLFSLLLYPDYSPIYLFSLNPVEAVTLVTVGCGFLSVIVGEIKRFNLSSK